MAESIKTYTVVIYTENSIGLLSQIANVFTRRNLNILSLSAGESAEEGSYNITVVTDGTERNVRGAALLVEKRVDVIRVDYYTDSEIVYKELAMYKVPTKSLLESGSMEKLLSGHQAKIVDINKKFTVIQKTGTAEDTSALLEDLKDYGICEFIRSGRIAVSKQWNAEEAE